MIAHWDGPRGYPWSVVRATLGGQAGLKTRAPSMRIPVIFRTPVIFTLPTQKSEATRDFAKALSGGPAAKRGENIDRLTALDSISDTENDSGKYLLNRVTTNF